MAQSMQHLNRLYFLLLLMLLVQHAAARGVEQRRGGRQHAAAAHAAARQSSEAARVSQAAAAAAPHLQPRRMMGELPLANTQIPTLRGGPAQFVKLGRNVSRALGTALNGSIWQPGACGSSTPTSLGYQCSWTAPSSGLVLHWTYTPSGSSLPPINRCTMQPGAVPNLEIQEALADGVVHMALQAVTKDKLHLVFLDPEGRYYPSEGVHGSATDPCAGGTACGSTSTPQVDILYQAAPGESLVTGRPSSRGPGLMEGWAGWVSADTDGNSQVLCLSRHVHTKLMKLGPQHSTDLLLSFAASSHPNYMSYSRHKGRAVLDLQRGTMYETQRPTGYLVAHGVLMLLAFGVLLPSGLLLARHKWLFVDEEVGLHPLWGLLHLCVLLSAALVALLGMIVALVRFGNTVTSMVMSTHQVLGLLSVGFSLALAVTYALRPFLLAGAHKHAQSPLLTAQKAGGCITVAAGWTSLFLGCVVVHRSWGMPYVAWLLPTALLTGVVAAAATLLELRYQKLLRSGAYNPKTCTRSNAGPSMPLARIRTHREPTNLAELKKHESPNSGGAAGRAHVDDGQPGSGGISGGMVAATILARGMHSHHSHQYHCGSQRQSDAGSRGGSHGGTPGARSSISSSGGSGGGAELSWRRGRQSTPNATAAAAAVTGGGTGSGAAHSAEVHTGFPSNHGTDGIL